MSEEKKDWKQAHYNIVKETLDISNKAKELLIGIEPVKYACKDDWGYRKGHYNEEEKLIKEAKKCLEKMAAVTARLQVLKDVYDNN